MARKFLTSLDLSKNELQNAAVQNLPSAPASPVKGQLYYNTTAGDDTLYWFNGTAWVPAKDSGQPPFGSVVPETSFGGSASDGVATTAARADHRHANPLHDAAAHASIPINAMGIATAPINMGGNKIVNVGDPTAPTDAANKQYVDNSIAGLSWKDSVRVGSTAQVALTGLTAIDGVTPIAGDRILLKNQTAPAENGIWVAAAAAWTRSTDADLATEILGAAVYVEEGTTQGDTAWVMTANAPITIGTTPLPWSQFAGGGSVTAGAGMTQAGNVLNVIGDASITVTADMISRAALTGDVTVAAGANAATIAVDAVTNPKLANMPALTVKGRLTAGAGDPEDLTQPQMMQFFAGFMARAYSQTLAGSAASYQVNHGMGSRDVQVSVYRMTAPYDSVECDIERSDPMYVTVRFSVAPADSAYRAVVSG
jgi:hypothetical protein